MNIADAFAGALQGGAVELRALETELSVPLLGMTSPMDAQTQSDMADLIVAALLQRSCNPIQMHLRLKKGFNATFAYDELNGLPTSAKEVARELARFYVRIADLRARILQEAEAQAEAEAEADALPKADARLQRAHAIQMENMHIKQRENQAQLDRIMRTIVSNPDSEARCIHEAVTMEDLDALDMQLQDVVERGCAANELRCLKITEAAIEQQKYEALVAELNGLMNG
jgi:N-acyl-D-aspartate/D-glutamate deacylase